MSRRCLRRVAALLVIASYLFTTVAAHTVPHLEQAFFFTWSNFNGDTQPFPVTVTQQCQTISIKWERGSAQGPNPVAPFYLQVYTSLHTVPIIIPVGDGFNYDWPVPFPPGTQYQICMFDKNGNTGGCQAAYTVIPAPPSSTGPSCTNVTLPPQLEVEGTVSNGPISRFGWIEQCTDIQLKPIGGTPPYTMTVAPSLHPPYNITGEGPLNWTVALSWSSPFFISLADSAGAVWSNGLLHAGGPGTSDCFVEKQNINTEAEVKPVVAIGAGVGGLALGLFLGLLIMFFFMGRKVKKLGREREALLDLSVPTSPTPFMDNSTGTSYPTGGSYPTGPTHTQYHVEPFVMPSVSEDGRRTNFGSNLVAANANTDRMSMTAQAPPSMNHYASSSSTPQTKQGAVYVLHHDANAAPVTIYHEQGQEIVELPPRYGSSPPAPPLHPQTSSDGRSDVRSLSDSGRTEASAGELPPIFQQHRQPNQGRKPSSGPRPTVPSPQGPR